MKHVFCAGNLLDSKAQVLINTVNCEGVMGKGIALQFKEAYAQMFFSYREFCAKGNMQPGNFHAWKIPNTNPQRYVFNFPTKIKWRNPSEYDWIEVGQLAKYYEYGEGLKGEFIESWNSIERFYERINKKFTPKILNLIRQLRQKGFDERLRAGQSLYTFMLSRSRRHGLTQEQNFIALKFKVDKDEMIVTDKENNELLVDKVELSYKLEQLFEDLAKEEIN